MSDDLVERLRTFDIYDYADADKICREAAARIAALEAAVTQCRTLSAMLKPQADRIAELEAALQDMAKHVWRGDWNQLKPETRALLEETK